jgi:predicted DNA-binding WGR domain protein
MAQAMENQDGRGRGTVGTSSPDAADDFTSGDPRGTSPEAYLVAALHYQLGGSDKVWAAVVTPAADGGATLLSCWGRRGAALSTQAKTFPATAKAVAQARKKVSEKRGEGYEAIAPTLHGIAETLSNLAREHGLALSPAAFGDGSTAAGAMLDDAAPGGAAAASSAERPRLSHVTVLPPAELDRVLRDERHGITEKVNGTRCVVRVARAERGAGKSAPPDEVAGAASGAPSGAPTAASLRVRAYNRRGVEQFSVPAGAARALGMLATPCVVDGERLEGEESGIFVAFDLLEWDGEDLRGRPYQARIARLVDALTAAGAIAAGAPTLAAARAATLSDGFVVLAPALGAAAKREVLAQVRAAGGEGIIARTLDGPSVPGDTRFERKHKLVASLDVFAVGIKPGLSAGSVRMGLVRESDGAVVEVGTVRSGFSDSEVAAIGSALEAGRRPVLEVTFLPVRTIGITLAEPRAVPRDDKPAAECTTAQLLDVLGADRLALIDAASALALPAGGEVS